jgi:two-component system, chemotaxis family, sensor kinase CheA
MSALLQQFLAEARDALQDIAGTLLRLEREDASHDTLTALFRLVHTLKGNSGLFTVPEMTRLLHAAEDLMDAVRHGQLAYSRDMTDALLEATDIVGRQCDDLEQHGMIGTAGISDAAHCTAALRALLDRGLPTNATNEVTSAAADVPAARHRTHQGSDALTIAELPELSREAAVAGLADAGGLTFVRYAPPEDAFFQGDDPLHLSRSAPEVIWGRIVTPETWPPLAELDAYKCVLSFELLSTAPAPELVEHFRYVADQVVVRPVQALANAVPTEPSDLAPGEPTAADAAGSGASGTSAASQSRTLKVDQARIDRLMALIGEMVVARNALPFLAEKAEHRHGSREMAREIKAHHAVVHRIVEELQDTIMQVRLMPVSVVFQRVPRLVRDIARKLGKDVQLVLEGEETEADKHMIEALSDPLVHIVRNSLDHGLETADERRAAGKPPVGTLRLAARQTADRVHIEITDDGRGIDPQRVKSRALERGLIDEATAERLTDGEAVNLIFLPGFSTADTVSDLSGRGVGMDVVRTALQRVHGSVSLHSAPGRGTRLVLSLPLSMAVTSVMLVEAGGQRFGIPMDSVVETVRVPRDAMHTLRQQQATVLRDRIVPLRTVHDLLALATPPRYNAYDEAAVLVVRNGAEYAGLVVDEFRGTQDIILTPLTGVLDGLRAYSGSALLGDGSVLMVLNLTTLL